MKSHARSPTYKKGLVMADKIMYLGFVVFVWLIYIAFSMPILLFFMSFNQALVVALIVATFITLLFILVQQTLQFLFSNEYQQEN